MSRQGGFHGCNECETKGPHFGVTFQTNRTASQGARLDATLRLIFIRADAQTVTCKRFFIKIC